jgi:hypothetical protein
MVMNYYFEMVAVTTGWNARSCCTRQKDSGSNHRPGTEMLVWKIIQLELLLVWKHYPGQYPGCA